MVLQCNYVQHVPELMELVGSHCFLSRQDTGHYLANYSSAECPLQTKIVLQFRIHLHFHHSLDFRLF